MFLYAIYDHKYEQWQSDTYTEKHTASKKVFTHVEPIYW